MSDSASVSEADSLCFLQGNGNSVLHSIFLEIQPDKLIADLTIMSWERPSENALASEKKRGNNKSHVLVSVISND